MTVIPMFISLDVILLVAAIAVIVIAIVDVVVVTVVAFVSVVVIVVEVANGLLLQEILLMLHHPAKLLL